MSYESLSLKAGYILFPNILHFEKNVFTEFSFQAFKKTLVFFLDVNECLTEGICGFGGQCTNTEDSYECTCAHGSVYNKEENFCQGKHRMNPLIPQKLNLTYL